MHPLLCWQLADELPGSVEELNHRRAVRIHRDNASLIPIFVLERERSRFVRVSTEINALMWRRVRLEKILPFAARDSQQIRDRPVGSVHHAQARAAFASLFRGVDSKDLIL